MNSSDFQLDSFPVHIESRMASLGLSRQGLSKKLNFSQNRLYTYFRSVQHRMIPYLVMARAGKVTLEQLREIINSGKFPIWIDEVRQTHKAETVTQLCRELRLSPGIWLQLQRGDQVGNTLNDAHKVAAELKMQMEELVIGPTQRAS